MFSISFFLYHQNKILPYMEVLLKSAFEALLLNNPLTFFPLINLDFLLSHTTQFDKSIGFRFLVFTDFWFLLSVFSTL